MFTTYGKYKFRTLMKMSFHVYEKKINMGLGNMGFDYNPT